MLLLKQPGKDIPHHPSIHLGIDVSIDNHYRTFRTITGTETAGKINIDRVLETVSLKELFAHPKVSLVTSCKARTSHAYGDMWY